MKHYENPYMTIYEMEEDTIRTSGLQNAGAGGEVGETVDGDSWGNIWG